MNDNNKRKKNIRKWATVGRAIDDIGFESSKKVAFSCQYPMIVRI